jgi:hypothetical protein
MARLPSREEIDYLKQRKSAQLPKILLDLGIDATGFDAAIYRIAKDQSLSLAPFRGEIIEACYYLYARTAPDVEVAKVRKAIRQVEQIPRLKDPLAALLRLRKKWTDEIADDACLAGLWSELRCDLDRFGIVFVERLGRFHISRFRKAEDVRICVKAACDECRSWWNHRDALHRGRPKDDPFRDWVVHLAVIFEGADGKLSKAWASWRHEFTRDHSPCG